MKSLRKGPSPALIVAVTAMAFALVGTAIAANDGSIYPKLSKSKVKKIAKKQATKQLKANVNNSHVNLADDAENLGGNPPSYYQKKGLAPFTPATLLNNWARFGNTWSEPGYWVDEDGVVNIQGSLQNGTMPAVFTLPEGIRPTTFRSYVIRCAGGVGHVEIAPTTGNVNVYSLAPANCATYGFLDGITFRPDN